MHHLKKWFGIKDWQGPESSAQKPEGMSSDEDSKPGDEKIDSSNPTDAKNEQTIQTNNHIITDKIDLFKPIPENESIFLKYNNRLEAWLREHIPVEGDECAQCRIVKTGAFGAAYTGVMVYMHRLEKEAELGRRGHRLFRVFQICAAPALMINLYFYLFKTGYYQQRREGETNSEFQQRIHIEELQWYWDMFRKIRNRLQQNNSDDDQK